MPACMGADVYDSSAGQVQRNLASKQLLRQAVACHHAGQLQEAARLYHGVLQYRPDQDEANHNLGVLLMQTGQFAASLPHFKAALLANAQEAQYWLSYVDALIYAGEKTAARQVLAEGRQRGLDGPEVAALAGRLGEGHSTGRSMPPVAEHDTLVSTLNQSRFADAEALARRLTSQYPEYGLGWKALGISLFQQQRLEDAIAPTREAVRLLPMDAEVRSNLAILFKDLGRLAEAQAELRGALEIEPAFAPGHYNLGNVLGELGRHSEAEASLRQAVQLKPDFVDAYVNLGNLLSDQERHADAEACYRRAIELQPRHVAAHTNLGAVLKELGRPTEAESRYRQALEIDPDFLDARINLANTLRELGRYAEAEACYRQVLEREPATPLAYNNLGAVLREQGRIAEAETCYRQALAIDPDFAEAHGNLGLALNETGRAKEAESNLRRALAVNPKYASARSNLLFSLNYSLDHDPETCLADAREYGRMVADKAAGAVYAEWRCAAQPERLRVGFVSGDLRNHPVGYFLEGLLGHLDPARLELIAYPTQIKTDDLTARIRPHFADWQSLVGLGDEAAARLIHDDGIHVLIDLSGHTGHNRLSVFARKPAPVQASWLGYFATTGVAEIDWLLADPWTLPEDEERHFTEKIWRLPETRLCFTPPAVDVEGAPLPARKASHITFGCFNNLAKLNDQVIAAWARVLAALPDSRVFLKAQQLADETVRQGVAERFAAQGVERERLIMEGPSQRAEYLAAYGRVDIALDPFPYPGGTTTAEALWMGVPVLTRAGQRFLSRQGAGLLGNAGLADWIATDTDDYVAKAVSHGADLDRLATLRAGLRAQVLASPLFDAARFARHFEDALWQMWRRHADATPHQG